MSRGGRSRVLTAFLIAGCAPASPARVVETTTVGPVRTVTAPPSPPGHSVRVVKQTTLTPQQETGLVEVTVLIEAASRAYKVPPPRITVYDRAGDAAGNLASGTYLGLGHIMLSARTLASSARDVVAAHEMGHYVLRHADRPGTRKEKEHEASIEAVRILQSAKGLSEEEALRSVLTTFERHRRGTGAAPAGEGHGDLCEEVHAVVAAYPEQRGWSSAFDCAPSMAPAGTSRPR